MPLDAYEIMSQVWGESQGYVFLPRKKNTDWEEGRGYEYPQEEKAIRARITLSEAEGYDTYWCPLVFFSPKRRKECVQPTQNTLWADLDAVDPNKLALKPSIAWKSSDNRYQALWTLKEHYAVDEVEHINKSLTYAVGADKGGWDVTQVLRVPGSTNYKYSPPQQGSVLWVTNNSYSLEFVNSSLSTAELPPSSGVAVLNDFLLKWRIPERARQLLLTPVHKVEIGTRSERLWELETLLLGANIPLRIVLQVIKQSVWNKFAGRADEDKQLERELFKADEYIKSANRQAPVTQDTQWLVPFSEFVVLPLNPPEWLIEGIWQRSTYGMIAGEPKTFKSVLVTDLAISVASGQPFLGVYAVPKQGKVLMLQDENSAQNIQDRVYKISSSKLLSVPVEGGLTLAMPDNLPVYFANNVGIDLTNPECRGMIEATLEELKPELVIFDPLYMMLGRADENDATEVRGVLQWLSSLRNKYECAIIIIHHYNKSKSSSRGGQNIRGTSQFHAWVECGLYVKTTSEAGVINIEREFRSYPQQKELRIRTELGTPGTVRYQVKLLEHSGELRAMSKEELLSLLSNRAYTADEIKKLLKVDADTIRKWLSELEAQHLVIRHPSEGRGKASKWERKRVIVPEEV